jgi:hypothetical protein
MLGQAIAIKRRHVVIVLVEARREGESSEGHELGPGESTGRPAAVARSASSPS